jgi:ATP-binding cassette subfamily F protein 3
VREERAKAPAAARREPEAAARKASRSGGAQGSKRVNSKRTPPVRRSRGKTGQELEAEIAAAEAALQAVEDELADPAAWATPEATERSSRRHEEAKRAVEELYERWEAVAG